MGENIDKILEKHNENVKRHIDVLQEHFDDKIQLVSEQVIANTEKTILIQASMDTAMDSLEIIKVDIEFIKNELKKKISRDEFAFLEKRVSMLEAKLNQTSR